MGADQYHTYFANLVAMGGTDHTYWVASYQNLLVHRTIVHTATSLGYRSNPFSLQVCPKAFLAAFDHTYFHSSHSRQLLQAVGTDLADGVPIHQSSSFDETVHHQRRTVRSARQASCQTVFGLDFLRGLISCHRLQTYAMQHYST